MDVPVLTNGGSTPRTWAVFTLILLVATLVACAGRAPVQAAGLAEATRKIGEAYMLQGDYTAALRELIRARDLYPGNALTHNDLWLMLPGEKAHGKGHLPFRESRGLETGTHVITGSI